MQEGAYEIRYTKLKVTVCFEQDGKLPHNKVSMLRGGVGEMLLRSHCISDRVCDNCSFSEECNVRRFYYHVPKIQPDFIKEKSGMGYLYEWNDRRTSVRKGEKSEFSLLLIGDLIVHFPDFLQALFMLGQIGMGKEEVPFSIVTVQNHRGEMVVKGSDVRLQYLKPDKLADYVRTRKQELNYEKKKMQITVCFQTPWTQKVQGKFISKFSAEAFLLSVFRRLYIMQCFEGILVGGDEYPGADDVILETKECTGKSVTRFSETHKNKIQLNGIMGEFLLKNMNENLLEHVIAGELLHIGKNTSMGFGEFRITELC